MRSIPRMGTALAMLAATAILAVPAGAQQSNTTEAERIADRTQALAQEGAEQSGKVVRGRLETSGNERTAAQTAAAGQWDSSCRLPDDFNLIHATVLRNGNLLAIAGSGNVPGGTRRGYILNPSTCSFTQLALPRDFFCSINVALPDGTVLMAGGTRQYDPFQGLRTAYLFNPGERTFTRAGTMAEGRWYPGATQLANGDVAVFSGLDTAGNLNTQVETYRWQTRTWGRRSYRFNVSTYAQMLPMAGGRLFFTGMGFGGSNRVGILTPSTGAWQAVGGLDPNPRDQGASFFVPGTQGGTAMVVGGDVNTSARIDLSSASPTYQPGPSLAKPTKFLSHGTLFDGTVLLAGGQDPAGNPVSDAYLYRPASGGLESVAPTSYAHQYHSVMWVDTKGRAWLGGGNPARGVEQPVLERFDPWYVDIADRPVVTSAPSTIAHNQAFSVSVRLAGGTTLERVWLHRPASVTHQFGAAEGQFSLARSAGSRWELRADKSLTPPGYYYLVATDSRGVPSVAKMVRVTS